MIYSLKKITPVILLFLATNSFGQSAKDLKVVDDYVKSVGSLDSMNMGTISNIITKNFPDNIYKARAIFDWIAYNISFDAKASRNGDNSIDFSDNILKSRKATSFGYAALYQDMCSAANIRCLTVDGYIKKSTDDINEKPDEFNHSWDVVQLGTSPSDWYYVDPTWGSGYTDKAEKIFTRSFNDAYFFADKYIFNQQHFPDNTSWQLGGTIKNVNEFFALPVVKSPAYEFGLTSFTPATGHIKIKAGKTVDFNIGVNNGPNITVVSLLMGDDKRRKSKQVNYSLNGGSISFSYKFDEEDSYPVTIVINGKEVLDYFVEVE
jgi:transglutaminase/protease-like cytokinesis protein 3